MFDEEKITNLKEMIAGEIIFSHNSGSAFKKWRNIFDVGQKKLAMHIKIKVSTISDYENGRRQNPTLEVIKRFVDALIEIDLSKRGVVIYSLLKQEDAKPFNVREFKIDISIKELIKSAKLVEVNSRKVDSEIYGITLVDTSELFDYDIGKYSLMHGRTNKRALYFSKTTDFHLIEYSIKILRYVSGQYPSLVIIEVEDIKDIEKYKSLKINLPLYITKESKEDVQNLF